MIQLLGTKQTPKPRLSAEQKNWNIFGMCQLLSRLASIRLCNIIPLIVLMVPLYPIFVSLIVALLLMLPLCKTLFRMRFVHCCEDLCIAAP